MRFQMNSLVRAALVAVAVLTVVPASPAFAQRKSIAKTKPAAQASWTLVAQNDVPNKVRAAQHRSFPMGKVTRVERSGTGATAFYRYTMTGKKTTATFDAKGVVVNAK